MIAAPTLDDVLRRAELFGGAHPLRDRLVSVVFSQPASLAISDLSVNRVFWDELTGESWDLFFAGYYAYGGHGDAHPICVDPDPSRGGAWHFSPNRFHELLRDVERAMQRSGLRQQWRFSGEADLVSFMVYGGEPDWPSLRSVQLLGRFGAQDAPSLGRVIEGLRRWQDEEPDAEFAPGSIPPARFVEREALRAALRWSAAAVVGGVLGNRADAILDHLLK